jgi:hypothetical protein
LRGSFNWICRRRFFRRQIAKGKFHCTIDRDACDALAFIDPGIRVQFLGGGVARIVQLLLTRFGSFGLVGIAVWRNCYQHQNENSEKEKEQNDAEPRSERNRRAF